jgi:hypothetical protein
MDAAYSAGDALAWTVALRGGSVGRPKGIGLRYLVDGKAAWTKRANGVLAREALAGGERLAFTLAVRELRNRNAHRSALNHGRMSFKPPAPGPEPSVVWVLPSDFDGDSKQAELHAAVARCANYVSDDMAVLTFERLIDETWCATSETINRALKAMPWGSRAWMRAGRPRGRVRPSIWWTRTQRSLWGCDRKARTEP